MNYKLAKNPLKRHKRKLRGIMLRLSKYSWFYWNGNIDSAENKPAYLLLREFLSVYKQIKPYRRKFADDRYKIRLNQVKEALAAKNYGAACHELHDLMYCYADYFYRVNSHADIIYTLEKYLGNAAPN